MSYLSIFRATTSLLRTNPATTSTVFRHLRLTRQFQSATNPPPRTRPASSLLTRQLHTPMDHPPDRNNEGLTLKRQLHDSHQQTWGFVIYRCTYADDRSWARFMTILNDRVRQSLEFYDTPDLLASLDWSVQEDRAALDGASKEVVRRRFREWVAGAAGVKDAFAPRFRYCVLVDKEALGSVVGGGGAGQGGGEGEGYVNVVCGDWEFEEDEGEEEVEGCRQHDVGWMKVPVEGLAPRTYSMLGESGGWEVCYVRPPDVAVP